MNDFLKQFPICFNAAAYFLESNLTQGNGSKIAFYTKSNTYTYAQTYNSVQCAATLFAELGVERENRIAIFLPNIPEFVFAFLGAIWLGAIPVPIIRNCAVNDVRYILHDSRAKILLSDRNGYERLEPLQSPFLRQIILTDGDRAFTDLLIQQNHLLPCAQTSRDEPVFWLYTSGSTGKAKGVVHLQQNMAICARNYGQAVLGLHENDITYSVAPLGFAYGLGNALYMPMAVGAAAVLSEGGNAFDIIADIERYKPTVFSRFPVSTQTF